MAQQVHAFTKKHPSATTGPSSSPKLKTLIQAYLVRALAFAKTLAIELTNSKNGVERYMLELRRKRKTKKIKGSRANSSTSTSFLAITMCFSWPSSHVRPMPENYAHDHQCPIDTYYDSSWNTPIDATSKLGEGGDVETGAVLSGYLQWLEEKGDEDGDHDHDGASEIDRLAEMFIEKCHEKFRLEKQESYRRYQEMLARSI